MSDPKKKICPLPFSQLSMHSSGRVTPCCWLQSYVVGDITKQSMEEIWNGEKLVALRKEFISGDPKICKEFIKKAGCNFHHLDLDEFVDIKEQLPMPMVKLDLMLGGKCNLECIMCENWKDPNGVYTEERFWIEARKNVFPHLKEIEVYGGEPFIQQEVYQLIEEVSTMNPDCRWMFTTNAHYKFNKKIKEALDKLKLHSISISIDSLNAETFSTIRKLGKLELVLDTLDDWLDYRKQLPKERKFIPIINVVIQKDNWREVGDFIRFSKEKEMNLFFYLLNQPEHLMISNMPDEDIKQVIDLWLEENKTLKDVQLLNLIRQLMELLPNELKIDYMLDFAKNYTETIEQIHYFKMKS